MHPILDLLARDRSFRTKLLLRFLGWTAAVLLFAVFGLVMARRDLRHEALIRARDALNKDLAYRHWVTHRGGVYVPVDNRIPPNPYLGDLPERDVTIAGRPYTLVNPAYMTRMVQENEARAFDIRAHLTSLDPLRPENAPDPWERKALERFAKGEFEVSEQIEEDGQPVVRYMRAFMVEPACLRCHAKQGYKVGDVRGGMSATTQLDLYFGFPRRSGYFTGLAGLAGLWLLGGIGLAGWTWRDWKMAETLRRTSDELRVSDVLSRSLVDSLSLLLVRVDSSGIVEFANAALLQLLGRRLDACVGRPAREIFTADAADALLRDSESGPHAGNPGRAVFQLPGWPEARGVEIIRTRIIDGGGRVSGLQVVFWDASERLQMEAALRRQSEHFRSLLDNSLSGYARASADGTILDVNDAFVRLLARSRDEIIGMRIESLEALDSPEQIRRRVEEIRLRGSVRFESRYRRGDGSEIEVELHVTSVTPGHELIAFVRDISAEKRAEKALRDSEERYRTVNEQCPFPVLIHQKGMVVYCNPAGIRLFKATVPEEVIGREVMSFVHPDFKQQIIERIRMATETGKVAELTEEKLIALDGSTIEAEVRAVPTLLNGETAMLVFAEEVSARNQALRALRESEMRLSTVFESVADGLFLVTAEEGGGFRFAEVNPSFVASLELAPEKLRGCNLVDALPPGTAAAWIERFREAVSLRQSARWEERFETSRGFRYAAVAVSPTFDEAGHGTFLIGSVHDITEIRRAEDSLRKSEERFRLIAENTADVIWIVDPRTMRFLYVSPSVERLRGFSAAEALQQTVSEVLAAESAEYVRMALPRRIAAFEEGNVLDRVRLDLLVQLRRDGSRVETETITTLLSGPDGKIDRILGVSRDISQRKAAEQAILERETAFRNIFESAGDAIYIASDRGPFLDVNSTACQMLGYSKSELLRLGPEGVDAPEMVVSIDPTIESIRSKGAATFESVHLRKDGTRVPVEINSRLIDYQGQKAILSFARDVSERKRAEAERTRLEAQVERTQRLESLGSLAGGIAHDMNNVLAAILGLASTSRSEIEESDPLAQVLDTIVNASARGRDMVKGLLDFSRRRVEQATTIDLNRLVEEVTRLLARTTLQKVRLVKDLHSPLLKVSGDPSALSHALMNVCINAIDAMGPGGELRIITRNLPDGEVVLRVEDDGCGMSADVLRKSIDPFFTTKAAGLGTGLGLAIVYGTVKAHEGSLDIESVPGGGTTVSMRFPGVTGVEAAREPQLSPPAGPQQKLRILLVDDDELIRTSVPRMLRALGHEVTTAGGGEEALERLAGGLEPDLMILDQNMPGMSGVDTLKAMEAMNARLPVLVATGYQDKTLEEVVAARPRTGVVLKPFALGELKAKLATFAADISDRQGAPTTGE